MRGIMSCDIYAEVTRQVIAMLDQGVVPWRSPILGQSSAGHPRNHHTGKPYRGINVFLLAFAAWTAGYASSHWLTFNQAKQVGASVRKGEKSSLVVFWKQHETTDRETGEEVTIPVLRHYRVFNVEQCEGIEAPDKTTSETKTFEPIEAAQAIVNGYAGGPALLHGGNQAYYRPSDDTVQLPEPNRFVSSEEYYSTLFHELGHSTGHATRLDRKLDTDSKPFGTSEYAREELVAEMAAAFLCSDARIAPSVIENQAAYIQGWLGALQDDKRLVITAAGAAQRAADWIRGERP